MATLLEGVRILDFGSFLAGPFAAAMMAQLGAEVIKVERPDRPDGARFFVQAPGWPEPDFVTGTQFFNLNNMNKKSLVINLATDEGKKIILDIAKGVDIIIENMKPGAIGKVGLGYEVVKAVNPGIIFVSSSACGDTGPDRDFVGYAANFANKTGLGHITGYPDAKPSSFVGPIDSRSAAASMLAMLAGLLHRQATGEGQFIDISSQEAIGAQIGDAYLDCAVNGIDPLRCGNHRESYVPNNAYLTNRPDEWLTISIRHDQDVEWKALCKLIGRKDMYLAYPDHAARAAHQAEIDEVLAAWAATVNNYEAMELLQQHGVPAGITIHGYDYLNNTHLRERGVFTFIPHPYIGEDCITVPCWRYSDAECAPPRHAPLFGGDTVEILKAYAGLSDEDIAGLIERKIVVATDVATYQPRHSKREDELKKELAEKHINLRGDYK